MAKIENLGVPMIGSDGQEFPGATLITDETINGYDQRRSALKMLAAGATLIAFSLMPQSVIDSAYEVPGVKPISELSAKPAEFVIQKLVPDEEPHVVHAPPIGVIVEPK